MFGGKPTKAEEEYMQVLKDRTTQDVISDSTLNKDIITGTRQALDQFNDQVASSQGVVYNQGMGDSVVTSQIGLKERAGLSDSLNTTAIDQKFKQEEINTQAKKEAQLQFYDLKNKLATRRQEISQGGFQNLVGGVTDAVAYNQEPKYVQSLNNVNKPSIMGYGAEPSLGTTRFELFGKPRDATKFGRGNAYQNSFKKLATPSDPRKKLQPSKRKSY